MFRQRITDQPQHRPVSDESAPSVQPTVVEQDVPLADREIECDHTLAHEFPKPGNVQGRGWREADQIIETQPHSNPMIARLLEDRAEVPRSTTEVGRAGCEQRFEHLRVALGNVLIEAAPSTSTI